MEVEHAKPLGNGHSVEIGDSTWDGGSERSVRDRFTNANGGFSTGSQEIPMHDVEHIVVFVAEHDELSPDECARMIQALVDSLRRRCP